jgi:mRNA interferase HigB
MTRVSFHAILRARTNRKACSHYGNTVGFAPMRVIARRVLREFWKKHPAAEQPLKAWFAEAHAARWVNTQAIKSQYQHASFVGDNRVVFNIGGNKFRLVVHLNFSIGVVLIKFVGTHADYDRIDAETV